MFCSQCGKENPASAKYCYNCGALIVIPDKSSASSPSVSTSKLTLKKIESDEPEKKVKHRKSIISLFIVKDEDDDNDFDDDDNDFDDDDDDFDDDDDDFDDDDDDFDDDDDDFDDDDDDFDDDDDDDDDDDPYDDFDDDYKRYHRRQSYIAKNNVNRIFKFIALCIITIIFISMLLISNASKRARQITLMPIASATNSVSDTETSIDSSKTTKAPTSQTSTKSSKISNGHSDAYNALTDSDKEDIIEIIKSAYAYADAYEGKYSGDKYSDAIWEEIEKEYHITESEVTNIWMNSN